MFSSNYQLSRSVKASELINKIYSTKKLIDVDSLGASQIENADHLTLPDGLVLKDYINWAVSGVKPLLETPEKFLTPFCASYGDLSAKNLVGSTQMSNVIDSEDRHVLSYVLENNNDLIDKVESVPPARTVVVFGIHSLIGLAVSERYNDFLNIIYIEDSLDVLCICAGFFDIQEFISCLKIRGIGFTILHAENSRVLKKSLLDFIGYSEPLCLYGITLIKNLVPSVVYRELELWMKSPDGITSFVPYLFGNETDEINQVLNANFIKNHSLNNRYSLNAYASEASLLSGRVILAASGPSLDYSIDELKDLQSKGYLIVSSGSSLGTLIRNGITPNYAVFLEMSSLTYLDSLELIAEGYDLSSITAVMSNTVDPRLLTLFQKCITFLRPHSASLDLYSDEIGGTLIQSGPQVANAALEFLLAVGVRSFLLFGCDFSSLSRQYTRSKQALGENTREMTVPVPGIAGTTVYSSPDLLITSEFFDNALKAFKADALTFTNRVKSEYINYADNLKVVSDSSSPLAIADFDSQVNSLLLHKSSSDFQLSRDQISREIAEFPIRVKELHRSIMNAIRSSSSWDLSLMRKLSQFCLFPSSSDLFDSLHVKIFRSAYFFLFQALQTTYASNNWNEVVSITSEKLDRLSLASVSYYQLLTITSSSKYSSIPYDPQTMRQLYKTLISNNFNNA